MSESRFEPPVVVKIKLAEGAKMPEYATPGAAGMDLSAHIAEQILINPGQRKSIPTGVSIELPDGYEAQVRGRSGLAFKHGVFGFLGTIDSDYRGEIAVLLINHGAEGYTVKPGDRVGQLIIAPVARAHLVAMTELGETERGEGGFGSTGK